MALAREVDFPSPSTVAMYLDTLAAAQAFATKIGKKAIVVKDFPGFATSRLGVILGCEAMRMLEQGVASA